MIMFTRMTKKFANEIITWSYEPPYDIYALRNPDELMTDDFQVYVENSLLGYICFGKTAQVPPYEYSTDHFDFGLAMRPDLTGQGQGKIHMQEIMNHLRTLTDLPLRLTVLTFNKRAINLYKNMGFIKVDGFTRQGRDFIVMEHLSK